VNTCPPFGLDACPEEEEGQIIVALKTLRHLKAAILWTLRVVLLQHG
jgi:hypothetical protein